MREDDRLIDEPMRPVHCPRCDGDVLVRKSSFEQTSIQWNERAMAACDSLARDRFTTCPALRAAIQQATLSGALKIAD